MKYLFVTGGVASGIGKGTIASSVGLLLQSHRKLNGQHYRVSAIKIDPYLNKSAGNMSPHEHGEVYVLNDGTETDLDLGNYERFLGIDLTRAHSITTGQVYAEVISREERGGYLGQTVQIVPHITDHIIERINEAAQVPVADINGVIGVPDIVIIELGGSVGDMESEPFLYAISRFALTQNAGNAVGNGAANVAVLHVGLLVNNHGEIKTKPLQHSMQAMRARGIFPDVLCCRCELPFDDKLRTKLSNTCHITAENVIFTGLVKTIYDVPKLLHSQHVCTLIASRLGMTLVDPDFNRYHKILTYFEKSNPDRMLTIHIIAKYSGVDTYLSLHRALEHAAFALNCGVRLGFVSSEKNYPDNGQGANGIIIPGGFGDRGIEGKISAITSARKSNTPVLGLCLGMQLLAVEEARFNGYITANSQEFDDKTSHPVVVKFADQKMRLGGMPVELTSKWIQTVYNHNVGVTERYRHRFHVNRSLVNESQIVGLCNGQPAIMVFPVATDAANESKWRALGVQFHPEYQSRNNKPHPIFIEFLKRVLSDRPTL